MPTLIPSMFARNLSRNKTLSFPTKKSSLLPNARFSYSYHIAEAHFSSSNFHTSKLYQLIQPQQNIFPNILKIISARKCGSKTVLQGNSKNILVFGRSSLVKHFCQTKRGDIPHLLGEVNLLFKEGKHKDCLRVLDECVKLNPKDARVWDTKLAIHVVSRELEKCLKTLDDYYKYVPENIVSIYATRAAILHDLKRYKESIEFAERTIQLDKSNAVAWYLKAGGCYHLGNYEDAITYSEKSLSIQSHQIVPYITKGFACFHVGRYTDAIECLDRQLSVNPKDVECMNIKAQSLERLGRFEEAEQVNQDLLKVNPTYLQAIKTRLRTRYAFAYVNLGNIAFKKLDYQNSLQFLDKALDINPRSALAWSNKATVLSLMNQPENALKAAEEALQYEPQNPLHYTTKGAMLNALNRTEEALECCHQAQRINPSWPFSFTLKAVCLTKLSKYQEAKSCLQVALQLKLDDKVRDDANKLLAQLDTVLKEKPGQQTNS